MILRSLRRVSWGTHPPHPHLHGGLAVVVRRVLRHVGSELCDAHLLAQVPLEAAEERLALRDLQAVDDGRDGAQQVIGTALRSEHTAEQSGVQLERRRASC